MEKAPKYIKELVNKYPKITSGRKNFNEHEIRIKKTITLINKYFKLKNKT